MKKRKILQPTGAELEILKVLWEHGPSTVRFVNEMLSRNKDVGYTTTLKFMQIMHSKKLLERDDNQRSHVYRAAVKESETKNRLLDKLLDTAFSGSAANLVVQALGHYNTSKEEIAEIRELLDTLEKEKK